MNLKYRRIGIDAKEFVKDEAGQGRMLQTFNDAKVFDSVGFSMIYTAVANMDFKNEIKKGNLVFFKANNVRGVGPMGRTVESKGSCEDVAEVFCYHLLKNLNNVLDANAVLLPTPYNFAEYENDKFWQIIAYQTEHLVKSNRMYGCVSPNVIDENGTIIHGDQVLKLIYDRLDALKSDNNNLFSYDKALQVYIDKAKEAKQKVFLHPIATRYNANILFFDYFIANSDRHCKNINYQSLNLGDCVSIIVPLALLDNGGALALQSRNCELLFEEQNKVLEQKGKFENTSGYDEYNPFDCQYDFNIGKDSFKNPELANAYDQLSYTEKIVMLISQNRILFNDFKNMYKNLDYSQALESMTKVNGYPKDYIPNFERVGNAELYFKKSEISKVMAKLLGEEFSDEIFKQNQDYYIDKFDGLVLENELNLHIASGEEIKEFETMLINFNNKKEKV